MEKRNEMVIQVGIPLSETQYPRSLASPTETQITPQQYSNLHAEHIPFILSSLFTSCCVFVFASALIC